MQEKKRYLQLEIIGERKFDEKEARAIIHSAIFENLGAFGASEANVRIKNFDREKQEVVIKCALKELEKVIAALALKHIYKNSIVRIKLKKISGKINKILSTKH